LSLYWKYPRNRISGKRWSWIWISQ